MPSVSDTPRMPIEFPILQIGADAFAGGDEGIDEIEVGDRIAQL